MFQCLIQQLEKFSTGKQAAGFSPWGSEGSLFPGSRSSYRMQPGQALHRMALQVRGVQNHIWLLFCQAALTSWSGQPEPSLDVYHHFLSSTFSGSSLGKQTQSEPSAVENVALQTTHSCVFYLFNLLSKIS